MRKIILIIISICFFSCNKNKNNLVLEYEEMAKNDIRKDKIKFFIHGLPLPPKNVDEINLLPKIDSLQKKYGLYRSSTCIISDELTEAENKYKEITNEYLIKRNGKNWEQKMKKQIDIILNR